MERGPIYLRKVVGRTQIIRGITLLNVVGKVFIQTLYQSIVKYFTKYSLVVLRGMPFADDFVGVSDSRESLQKLIDVIL